MLKLNTPQIKVVMEKAEGFEKHILQEAIKRLLGENNVSTDIKDQPYMFQLLIDNQVLIHAEGSGTDSIAPVISTPEAVNPNWNMYKGTEHQMAYQRDLQSLRVQEFGENKDMMSSLDCAEKQIIELGIENENLRVYFNPNFAFDTRSMEFMPYDTIINADDPDNHVRMFTSQSKSLLGFLEFLQSKKAMAGTTVEDTGKVVIIVNQTTNGIFSRSGYVRYAHIPDDNAWYDKIRKKAPTSGYNDGSDGN